MLELNLYPRLGRRESGLCPTARHPVALHVHQESRREFLRQYPVLFKNRINCYIRFNSDIDTLCLHRSLLSASLTLPPGLLNSLCVNFKYLTIDLFLGLQVGRAGKLSFTWPTSFEYLMVVYDLDSDSPRHSHLQSSMSEHPPLKIQVLKFCPDCPGSNEGDQDCYHFRNLKAYCLRPNSSAWLGYRTATWYA